MQINRPIINNQSLIQWSDNLLWLCGYNYRKGFQNISQYEKQNYSGLTPQQSYQYKLQTAYQYIFLEHMSWVKFDKKVLPAEVACCFLFWEIRVGNLCNKNKFLITDLCPVP